MLRIALARKRTGSPVWPTTRIPAACFADGSPVVQRLERDVVREDRQEHEDDDNRLDETRRAAAGDPETEGKRDDDAELDDRVEEAGEES